MQNLIVLIKSPKTEQLLPFSIYTSPKEQSLLNVPVVKPLLIVVLGGNKQLGKDDEDLTMKNICEQLALSESTLRRKLKVEGTSIQNIKDQVKLGLGLHLLQTTLKHIGLIAQTVLNGIEVKMVGNYNNFQVKVLNQKALKLMHQLT